MAFEQLLSELHITNPSYYINYANAINTEMRLERITKRQMESTSMLKRLQAIIDQIEENFQPPTSSRAQVPMKDPAFIADHNYAFSNSSSGISVSSSSSSTVTAPSENEQRFNRTTSAKRKIIDDEYKEFSAEDDHSASSPPTNHVIPSDPTPTQYPQEVGDIVLLGPNGTQVDVRSYSSIIWSSAASATRQLLSFIFSSDVLATHTLTGKPSPAFYGRERPAKMQLDPIKAADIIHCVKSKFNCSEREIRAAITTKCSDTSKKYKRRSQKQIDSTNKM